MVARQSDGSMCEPVPADLCNTCPRYQSGNALSDGGETFEALSRPAPTAAAADYPPHQQEQRGSRRNVTVLDVIHFQHVHAAAGAGCERAESLFEEGAVEAILRDGVGRGRRVLDDRVACSPQDPTCHKIRNCRPDWKSAALRQVPRLINCYFGQSGECCRTKPVTLQAARAAREHKRPADDKRFSNALHACRFPRSCPDHPATPSNRRTAAGPTRRPPRGLCPRPFGGTHHSLI